MVNTIKKREWYITQIRPYIQKPVIKVILGQRRVGKSSVLLLLREELKDMGVREDEIVYINKENLQFDMLRTYTDLYEYSKSYQYIFIDEIGEIEGWEKAVRSLLLEGKDIYITGSNSNLLSGELATFLSGRYVSFEIFPLNYSEFLDFHELERSKESFALYLRYGGLPYLIHMDLSDEIYTYLRDIKNTIVLKDVISRYKIKNIDFYEKLIMYLSQNIGTIFSSNSISKYLKSQSTNINTNVVIDYLNYTRTAFLINELPRYDIKGKKTFEIKHKYFFTDIGIRNSIVNGYSISQVAGVLENIVYINLVSAGFTVYTGEIGDAEIDFVAIKNDTKIYIQVAYLLSETSTIEREFGNLQRIDDNYPKYVVSMDEFVGSGIDGILHKNLIDFILEIPTL